MLKQEGLRDSSVWKKSKNDIHISQYWRFHNVKFTLLLLKINQDVPVWETIVFCRFHLHLTNLWFKIIIEFSTSLTHTWLLCLVSGHSIVFSTCAVDHFELASQLQALTRTWNCWSLPPYSGLSSPPHCGHLSSCRPAADHPACEDCVHVNLANSTCCVTITG